MSNDRDFVKKAFKNIRIILWLLFKIIFTAQMKYGVSLFLSFCSRGGGQKLKNAQNVMGLKIISHYKRFDQVKGGGLKFEWLYLPKHLSYTPYIVDVLYIL